MIRAVLLDFGGTLDTDGIHWSEKFWDIYQRLEVNVAKSDYERAYVSAEERMSKEGPTPQATLRSTLKKQLGYQVAFLRRLRHLEGENDDRALAATMADECYRDVLRTIAAAKPHLRELAGRYRLGLVSNFNGNLERVCRELEISGYFSTLVDSALVGVAKPDPAIFGIALRHLDVPAENSLMLGDSYDRDIVPAKQAGCTTVWLRGRSWRMPESSALADFTISTLAELPGVLLGLGKE